MEKLKELRMAAGYTQLDLAKMLGMDRSSVAKWETGEGMPSPLVLLRLSKIFGVSMETLIEEKLSEAE